MKSKSFNFKEFNYLSDSQFPVACNDLSFSQNKKKLLAVGIYKPSVKMFDMKTSIMKFERHLASDPIKVLPFQEDAEKFSILRNDRTLEFHITGGFYDKIKLPQSAREMALNSIKAELYLGGAFKEVYRFSLDQGRFLKSIPCNGATSIALSPSNGLICTANENKLSFHDSRSNGEVFSREYKNDILCCDINSTGLNYSIGKEDGECIEYDFRSDQPQRSILQSSLIKKIRYHNKNILFSTNDSLFILPEASETCDLVLAGVEINTFDFDGGVILVGGECSDIKGFYSEHMGVLPNWFVDVPKSTSSVC